MVLSCNIQEESILLKSINVIVFLGAECPISQQYTKTINDLHQKFGNDTLSFLAIFPENLTKKEESNFRSTYSIRFKSLIDEDLSLVNKLSATITPEVFIVDEDWNILYQGAIDNWYVKLGENRPIITEHYLNDNLKALIHHKQLPYSNTKPVGCLIEK